MTTKVEEAVGLAQQISGPEQQLKKLENAMSLKEYVQYIDETGRGKSGSRQHRERNLNIVINLLDAVLGPLAVETQFHEQAGRSWQFEDWPVRPH